MPPLRVLANTEHWLLPSGLFSAIIQAMDVAEVQPPSHQEDNKSLREELSEALCETSGAYN